MFFTSFLLGVGLAMDAFTVSLCVSIANKALAQRSKARLAFHFGIFQGLMTVLGWLAGSTIVNIISAFDHWIAFGLLAVVGVRMIRSGLNPDGETFQSDPSRGGLMVMLSLATSMDALAVGFSMAMLESAVIVPALIIGVVTFGLSLIGVFFGCKLGAVFGKRMEVLGGLILIGIGLHVLWSHLM